MLLFFNKNEEFVTLESTPELDSDVSLTLKVESDADGRSIITSLDGVDNQGQFALSGHIDPDGKVFFRREYYVPPPPRTGTELLYDGFLIPWGMSGRHEDGLFWLYKDLEDIS